MTAYMDDATTGQVPNPMDRRPIAARQLKIFQAMARSLARWGVSPNSISILGMVCGIGAGLCLTYTNCPICSTRVAWIAAAVLIQCRLLANMLDGMVAVESGRTTRVGELYNEIPDRVSDTAILIGAGYAVGGHVILGYAAALMAVLTAYVRAVGKASGAPQEFCGPMAKPQRMALITLLALYCGLTPKEWQLPVSIAGQSLGPAAMALIVIIAGCAVTFFRRLWRISTALKRGTS